MAITSRSITTSTFRFPGNALKAENGKYRFTSPKNCMRFRISIRCSLIAVDHPADLDIYTNDKFKSPPYPEFRLFGAREKIHPVRAIDAHGVDATQRAGQASTTLIPTLSSTTPQASPNCIRSISISAKWRLHNKAALC